MPRILQNTLFLLIPGRSLHKDGEALRVEEKGRLVTSLPVHNIDSVAIFTPDFYVSPEAMHLCLKKRVPLNFFTEGGKLLAHVEGVPQGSVFLRRAQHKAVCLPEAGTRLARAFVAGKIHNTRWLISRTIRDASEETTRRELLSVNNELSMLLRMLPRMETVDEVRGLEGRAAALYFSKFSLHLRPGIREKFPVDGRNRRPPRDAVNCLLSFLYALQRHACVSALAAVGLDPFVGYLHVERAGRESLALDFMEEFRPWVERFALTLINRGECKPSSFIPREGGSVELAENARKEIIQSWQERRRDTINHPLYKENVQHRQVPLIQARLLSKALRENGAYEPMLYA